MPTLKPGRAAATRAAVAAACLLLTLSAAHAQDSRAVAPPAPQADHKPDRAPRPRPSVDDVHIFQLHNISQQNDANEILVAVRNMVDPSVKIYLLIRSSSIVMEAPPDQIALAQRLIEELDRPRPVHHLAFTITEFDGDHRLSAERLTVTAADGQRVTLKQGHRIPIVINLPRKSEEDSGSVISYTDLGLALDVTPTAISNGVSLKVKVEQSTPATGQPTSGTPDPAIQQLLVEATTAIHTGKPTVIGSATLPNSTHRLEVAASIEP